jgi:WD40 repeat protein
MRFHPVRWQTALLALSLAPAGEAGPGEGRATLKGHDLSVWSVAYSSDGRTLASGSYDRAVRLWEAATRIERASLTGHGGEVFSVAFSPDGKELASTSWDQTVKLWDLAPR